MEIDCIFHCCGGCHGLFSSAEALSQHKDDCKKKPDASAKCQFYACENNIYFSCLKRIRMLRRFRGKKPNEYDCSQDGRRDIDERNGENNSGSPLLQSDDTQIASSEMSGDSPPCTENTRRSLRRNAVEKFMQKLEEMKKKPPPIRKRRERGKSQDDLEVSKDVTNEGDHNDHMELDHLEEKERNEGSQVAPSMDTSETTVNEDEAAHPATEKQSMIHEREDGGYLGEQDTEQAPHNRNAQPLQTEKDVASNDLTENNATADLASHPSGNAREMGVANLPIDHLYAMNNATTTDERGGEVVSESRDNKSDEEDDDQSVAPVKRKRPKNWWKNGDSKSQVQLDRTQAERDSTLDVKVNIFQLNKEILEKHGVIANTYEEICEMKHFKCKLCKFETKFIGMFVRHLNSHNNDADDGKFFCPKCCARFLHRRTYNAHLKTHDGFLACNICDFTCGSASVYKNHLLTHGGKRFKCKDCDYTSAQKKCLIEHRRKHTGERFVCKEEDCTFSSIYFWTYKAHLEKHKNKRQFMCEQCGFLTNDSSSFKRHARRHSATKAFKCSQCKYRGITRGDIVKHMRSHTQEKVYFCDQCNYSSAQASGIKLHMMQHRGMKPFFCTLCNYASNMRAKIARHIKQRHKGHDDQALIGFIKPEAPVLAGQFRKKEGLTDPKDYKVIRLNSEEIESYSKEVLRKRAEEEKAKLLEKKKAEAKQLILPEGQEKVVVVMDEEDIIKQRTPVVNVEAARSLIDDDLVVEEEVAHYENITLFQCGFCNMVFNSQEGVEDHSLTEHWDCNELLAMTETVVSKESIVHEG